MPGMTIEIYLKKGHDRRALAGHPWIFAGEAQSLPKTAFSRETWPRFSLPRADSWAEDGSIPTARFCRLLDGQRGDLESDFFLRRLEQARDYRRAIGYEPECYRLASSEGDRLPG
jgi:23S rRNA (cytosine1962-C5)-methyltransferase